jgi:hypothetical protein
MPQIDLETRLKQLHEKLAEVEDLRELSESPPWLKVKELLLSQIWECERNIVNLSSDPVKNQVLLIETKAYRDALGDIVLMQDQLPGRAGSLRAEISEKLQILKQTHDLPRPSQDAPVEQG